MAAHRYRWQTEPLLSHTRIEVVRGLSQHRGLSVRSPVMTAPTVCITAPKGIVRGCGYSCMVIRASTHRAEEVTAHIHAFRACAAAMIEDNADRA
jgi:hypothetical protein